MCAPARQLIILGMTSRVTASKVLLVADRRAVAPRRESTPVRRYRLARVRFERPPAAAESRFDYLKRVYD
jgi:hypothetical protein